MSWVKKGINHLVLLAIGLIWVYPFLWMISASFKSQNEFFNNRLGLIPQAQMCIRDRDRSFQVSADIFDGNIRGKQFIGHTKRPF